MRKIIALITIGLLFLAITVIGIFRLRQETLKPPPTKPENALLTETSNRPSVSHDAEIVKIRPAARERPGKVVDHADLDLLFLGLGGKRQSQGCNRSHCPAHKTGGLALGH